MTFAPFALHRGHLLILLTVGVVLASCDGGGSKQASHAQQLSGKWQDAEQILVDGTPHDRDLYVEIDEGTGRKSYRLTRVSRGDTTTVEGMLEVGPNNTLRMTGGFTPYSLVWTFDFDEPTSLSGSVQWTLQSARRESIAALLDVLGIGGTARRVEMALERP